jgi:glucose/arabinose dehydrogenase
MGPRHSVTSVEPPAGIPGGEVRVRLSGLTAGSLKDVQLHFSSAKAHLAALNTTRALTLVPDLNADSAVNVSMVANESIASGDPGVQFTIGKKLAHSLHPVANPAFDPQDGALFVTRSGTRGEHVPVSIFRIDQDGGLEDFSSEVVNPTAIAFDRGGRMFVTSRFDGTVYRLTRDGAVVTFAADLGIATGLAFNREGEMFVGDRSGTIYRINEIGGSKPWAEHEPAVSAYHLAFGPDDNLYVSGPTVSSFDSITRFDDQGQATVFFRGLGRPQGLAFDQEGNLYVAAALRGRRGVVRIAADGKTAELVVAGMNVVGLAFGPAGQMVVATNEAVYSLPLGIQGVLT